MASENLPHYNIVARTNVTCLHDKRHVKLNHYVGYRSNNRKGFAWTATNDSRGKA